MSPFTSLKKENKTLVDLLSKHSVVRVFIHTCTCTYINTTITLATMIDLIEFST